MAQPLSDYFAQEAGEYLDQLDLLLAGAERPDPVRFFRLVRGVRGSAQIAGAEPVAEVAERLEDGARALRDGLLHWSDEILERARRTVEDLRALVEAHPRWDADERERARAAAERWAEVRSGRRRSDHPAQGDQLFAFVRREIAGVVSEMERVLGELVAAPGLREPLRTVLRRMRPVRGVAGMEVLAPVLEVLEGIEEVAHGVLTRSSPVTRDELELLGAGRDALRAVGSTLERGETPGDSPELATFRTLRERAEEEDDPEEEAEVVPISRFFHDDEGPRIVSSPVAPLGGEAGALPPAVESFLRIEATGFLDRAEGLIATLPARPHRFGRVARQLAELAASVRELAGTYGMGAMAAAADLAATRLHGADSADEARAALGALRSALPGAPPAPGVSASLPAEVAMEESSQVVEEGIVPIESLFYDPGDALREALEMRGQVEALAAGAGDGALREALDELFGLLALAGRD